MISLAHLAGTRKVNHRLPTIEPTSTSAMGEIVTTIRKALRMHPILAPNALPIVETVGKLTRQPIAHPPNATTRVATKFSTPPRSGSPISSQPTGMGADEAVAAEVADEAEAAEAYAEVAGEAVEETPTRAGTCRSSIHHLHPLPKKARSSKRRIPSKSIAKPPSHSTTREVTGSPPEPAPEHLRMQPRRRHNPRPPEELTNYNLDIYRSTFGSYTIQDP